MLEQLALNPCHAIGCAEMVDRAVLFCDRHDRMLHSDIRTLAHRFYRPGKRPSKRFERYLQMAQEEILFAQSAGYRMPRAENFQW